MSDYEFWKDLGNIFDAIVNYQKKNVEFNNRFINPWIRLGNIFDRDDQHKEAVQAYQRAIEIDPQNAQNWADLGDALFKMGSYDEAAAAYNKAVELDPKAGWPVSNLALTLVTQGKCEEAIPLYLASLDLLKEDKDKAVAWNRLGNVYRKLNDYENAFLAFQRADELDGENTGFRDQLDETTETNTMVAPEEVLVQMDIDQALEVEAPVGELTEEIIAQIAQPEVDLHAMDSTGSVVKLDLPNEPIAIAPNMEMKVEETISVSVEIDIQETFLESQEPLPAWLAQETLDPQEESVAEEVQEEISSEELPEPVTQVIEELVAWSKANLAKGSVPEVSVGPKAEEESAIESVEATSAVEATIASNTSSTSLQIAETYTEFISTDTMTQLTLEDTQPIKVVKKEAVEAVPSEEIVDEIAAQPEVQEEVSEVAQEIPVSEESAAVIESSEAAYEEYLKDAVEPVSTLSDHLEDVHSGAPMTKVSESGDVRIAMDTQNAHVWNELGNVYLNSAACDDAVAAYSKAIELDRQFAWPYSNLALAYVQKNRFAEAILLYQRSIELFALDKDKAVTWNRLGNVYRRLNDYANAIAAYQTADDLDPDNATLSLRSHYGLLGNLYMDQKPNYVS